jgi:Tat protein secretion system quality control protein TatD with DNase activity
MSRFDGETSRRKKSEAKWVLRSEDGTVYSYTENDGQLKSLYEKKLIIGNSEIFNSKENRVVSDKEVIEIIKKLNESKSKSSTVLEEEE